MSADSHSEPLGVVLQGRYWLGEDDLEDHYSVIVLRVDDDDEERPDILDLRLDLGEAGELLLSVPRVDLLRALNLLGVERGEA